MSEDVPHPVTTTTTSTTSTVPPEDLKPAKETGEVEEEGGGGREEEEVQGAEGSLRGRRKLENADSSYDSDFDPKEEDQHGDVCRTVSDTLGAEFAEYVTTSSHSTVTPPPVSSTSVISSSSTSQQPQNTQSTSPSLKSPITPTPTTPTKAATTPGDTSAPTTAATTTTASPASPTTTTASSDTPTSTTQHETATTTTTTTSKCHVTSPTTTTTTTTTSSLPPTPTTTTTTTKDTTSTTSPPTLTLTQPPVAPKPQNEVGTRTLAQVGDIPTTQTCPSATITTTTISTTTTLATAATTTTTTTTTLHQRPTYASQVEFGIKLGYSEALVQQALIKLGATPDKDDLLAELIRLGTTIPPRPEGSGGGGGAGGGGPDGEDREEMLLASSTSSQHHLHLGQHPHHHHLQDQQQQQQQTGALRPVIIDGSNVAMSHGNKSTFSCRGLRVCVDWFRARGHAEITVFVPSWRKEAPRWDTPIADQEVLLELERERVLVFTPSRVCGGKRIVSYDDRYILKEAVQSGGVVVSNDNYRDLVSESPGFRRVVEENLLMYSWVNGRFVPPDDPLGRSGPTLDVFLRRSSLRDKDKQAPCPYGRKCTYGNKCKYKHPERGTAPLKSVTERLHEQAQRHYQAKAKSRDSSPGEGLRGSLSLPVCAAEPDVAKKAPLTRTHSIVPTVSLTLPSALTQDTPAHDHSPATTPATPAPSHQYLMPPPLDPLRSATLYKSDSALYHHHLYHGPPGYGAWGWEGGQQGGGAGHYGAHMPLGKQQSDPDQQDNPHRKLQRQLTLNPSYDSRLYKIQGFREPAPEHFPLGAAASAPGQTQGQGSPSRVGRAAEGAVFPPGQGRASPGYSSGPYSSREQVPGGMHAPLARHSSQDGGKPLASLPPHLYPSYSHHPLVTRFASAPDPIWGGSPQQAAAAAPPLITRLNSTSDTRLNLYAAADTHYFTDMYKDALGRPTSYAPLPHAPGPVGSRPMSPQSTGLHHSPSVSPRGHTPPQQQAPGSAPTQTAPAGSFPPPGHEDTRLKVFYHLSQLFPEAQVRAIMAHHPEETDPQKICGYILAAAAAVGQGTSRPMSPQHQAAAAAPQPPTSPYLLQTFPGGSLSEPPASHEDARLRAFSHLSQLFPEAEVRAVLARAPDETDIEQFCAALLARRAAPQT